MKGRRSQAFSTLFPYINAFERAYLVHLMKKYGNRVSLKTLFSRHLYSETNKLLFIQILELKIFSENLYYFMIFNDIKTYQDLFGKFPSLKDRLSSVGEFFIEDYYEFTYKTIRNLNRLLILKNELSKNLNFYDFITITEIKNLQAIYREFSLEEKRVVVGKRINLKCLNDLKSIGTRNISFKIDKEGKQMTTVSDILYTLY